MALGKLTGGKPVGTFMTKLFDCSFLIVMAFGFEECVSPATIHALIHEVACAPFENRAALPQSVRRKEGMMWLRRALASLRSLGPLREACLRLLQRAPPLGSDEQTRPGRQW